MKMFKFIVIDPVKFVIKDLMPIYYFLLGAVVASYYLTFPNDELFLLSLVFALVMVSVMYFTFISAIMVVVSSFIRSILMIHPRWRKKLKEHVEKVYENDTKPSS